MLITILIAILAINILVLVHEFGHFIAAKRSGIIVEIFSIGFGPKIFGFKYNGTEYKISVFLFGGYVKFKGDELEQINADMPGSFYSAKPIKRILVCFAGGFFNIILACILYTVISYTGKPVPEDSLNTIIGGARKGSVAEKIGLMPGDEITKIDGRAVDTWEDLIYAIAFSKKGEIEIEIQRDGEIIKKSALLIPEKNTGIRMLGIYINRTIIIGKIITGSSADEKGLRPGDRIVAVNGLKIYRFKPLIKKIRQNRGRAVTLSVIRDGNIYDVRVVPGGLLDKKYGAIGIVEFTTAWAVLHQKPWVQFWDDLERTWQTLAGLITRRIPVRAISGPVGIIGIIGISLHVGLIQLLSIIALISLNLGIVNLLPIPVLDGGHIVFNLVEMARKKPLSLKTIERIQNVFTGLLIALAIYVTCNDILRTPAGAKVREYANKYLYGN